MRKYLKRQTLRLSKQDIQNLSCFFYNESNGLLATVFYNFPLSLKRHCVQTAVMAAQMALHVPDSAVPAGMTHDEYENAVRYGSLYHDIGAYLVYNQRSLYPAAGERFLREQIAEDALNPAVRRVILQTVQFCGERYDGQGYPSKLAGAAIPLHAGICAIADQIDSILSDRKGLFAFHIHEAKRIVGKKRDTAFSPDAADCFIAEYKNIVSLYKHWRKTPPFWDNRAVKPTDKSINRAIV